MKTSPLVLPLLGALLLTLFPFGSVQAQESGTVSGVVNDAEAGTPMKGATALLRDPADSTAKKLGDVSDAGGAFSITGVPLGKKLVLEVRYVGYETAIVEGVVATAAAPEVKVGELVLSQRKGGSTLHVTAERPQVAVLADKTVYSVEGNPAYTAVNVSELLGQIPSVDVDGDGKVSLRGNDQVTIMMNDRPITMSAEQRNTFLKSLPANSVKAIEVRTSPGAQYSAEYGGGIINIVTRRTMSDMIGGSLNAGIDTRLGHNVGGGLYYNNEGLNVSLGGGLYREKVDGTSSTLRLNYADSVERRDVGSGTGVSNSRAYNGYGQIDYSFTPSDLASLSFNLNEWRSDYTSSSTRTFSNVNDVVVGRFSDSTGPRNENTNSGAYNFASLLLRHTFSGDHKISLDVGYNNNSYNGDVLYSASYFGSSGEFDSARSSTRTTVNHYLGSSLIASLDYTNPINDSLTLSFGARNERNKLDNNTAVDVLNNATGEFVADPVQTNHYLSENTIYGLYGNVSWRPLAAIGVQAGVRVEQATVAAHSASGAEIVSRDYTNIFPSGSLTWSLAEGENITVSYRRSIALPDIEALNPTRVRWGDFIEYSGNADLEPEFTHQFQLAYSTFWGMGNMISLSPYYSTTTGSIEQNQEMVGSRTYMTAANFNGGWTLGTEGSVSLRPLPWLNVRISGNVFRKVNRGGALASDIYSAALGYSSNGSVSVDLNESLTLSANFYASTPASVGAVQRGSQVYSAFALRQSFLDKQLNVTLRLKDPFDMQQWSNGYDGPAFYTESTNKWNSRFVGLDVSYSFGTTPQMEEHRQEKSETKGSGGNSGGGQ